jgi:hypothetical protein
MEFEDLLRVCQKFLQGAVVPHYQVRLVVFMEFLVQGDDD